MLLVCAIPILQKGRLMRLQILKLFTFLKKTYQAVLFADVQKSRVPLRAGCKVILASKALHFDELDESFRIASKRNMNRVQINDVPQRDVLHVFYKDELRYEPCALGLQKENALLGATDTKMIGNDSTPKLNAKFRPLRTSPAEQHNSTNNNRLRV